MPPNLTMQPTASRREFKHGFRSHGPHLTLYLVAKISTLRVFPLGGEDFNHSLPDAEWEPVPQAGRSPFGFARPVL